MALGKGLGSLIPSRDNSNSVLSKAITALPQNLIHDVDPKLIQVNPHQPRQRFNPAELEDLINSVKIHGIIQPLVVTKRADGVYELIAGERRLRSARALDLPTVPVIIRELKEQEKLELALIENIQRKNLNALEEAVAYQRLMDEFNLTQEEVAKRVGKSRSTVANLLRILALPEAVRSAIMDERINEGHARAIAGLESEANQLQLLRKILENKMSVRDAEGEVKSVKKFKNKVFDPVVIEFEEKLRNKIGTRVSIKKVGNKGEIKIPFNGNEDFKNIISKLLP